MAQGVSKASRTVKNLIRERINLLWDFGICNRSNEDDIRLMMKNEVEDNPGSDPETVLERITSRMINAYNWEN